MTLKTKFRILLLIYCIAVACEAISDIGGDKGLPEAVRLAEQSDAGVLLGPVSGLLVSGSVIAAFLAGLVGLFFFVSAARYIFVFATVAMIALWPLAEDWRVVTAWEESFKNTQLLLVGLVIALCFFGPVKELFTEGHGDSNQRPAPNGG